MTFPDGSREPLHGHNYRVRLRGDAPQLKADMVFDFLHIKPIVKELCDELDHKVLMPRENPQLRFDKDQRNIIITAGEDRFSIPKSDVLFLPIANTSVELLAQYLAQQIQEQMRERHQFNFSKLEVEVEESYGQSAIAYSEE